MRSIRSLYDLKKQKRTLKNEIAEIESLITFKNPKASLSVFTNGFTDRFLSERKDDDGKSKLALNTGNLVNLISDKVKENISSKNKNALVSLKNENLSESFLDSFLKISAVNFVGNLVKKQLYHKSWTKRILGIAILYIVPIFLRSFIDRVENSKKNIP
ncbi:hypothetical protein [Riemerella columbipharyngis]|uniref:Phosphoribosyl-ATP pyrophosphatase n=1 Tax=Riemerella columbipharyngis TaxID=1071918 RepID=A0A1G6YHT5_9FLAO|nr:hypothetical protein [Riemerella columbipharyngis]SDD89287.1 hypothetical protein SAMN05421544_101150 [Riemerella columbipharyngis]